jgi:hypothetical protein
MKREGLYPRGEQHPAAKLSEAKVRHIRMCGDSLRDLARQYRVGLSTIHWARVGETWGHVRP